MRLKQYRYFTIIMIRLTLGFEEACGRSFCHMKGVYLLQNYLSEFCVVWMLRAFKCRTLTSPNVDFIPRVKVHLYAEQSYAACRVYI